MLRPGDVIDRYSVHELIGQGGMGCVYRAHDSRLDRRVALKVIAEGAASDEARARLLREARAAAALDHPHAVAIFDVGEIEGAPYVVMELVVGRTLRDAVGATSVSAATRVGWLVDIGHALGAAHNKGLVHRDIKPENVMVRDDGVVKVLDFGIARSSYGAASPSAATQPVALPTLTRDGVSLGTPAYMAPEQIKGDPVDGRTDQFAWGVLAYELLTGRLPWRGTDPLAAAASIVTDEPDPVLLTTSGAPAAVCSAILRALSKRPADRFATMHELLRSIEVGADLARGGEPVAAREQARGAPGAARMVAAGAGEAAALADAPPEHRPPAVAAAVVASATAARQYSSGEMRQILSRAVDRQAQQPGTPISFDDLLDAAREVGVEEEVLREASREIRLRAESKLATPSEDDEEFAAWRRRKRRGFFRHLAAYVAVNGALLLAGLLVGKPQMAMGGIFWAIGLVLHAFSALTASRDDWSEIQAKRRRRSERRRLREERRHARKRHHEEVLDRVIDEGASLLLAGGEKLRRRIESAAGATGTSPDAGPRRHAGVPTRGRSPAQPAAGLRIDSTAVGASAAGGTSEPSDAELVEELVAGEPHHARPS